MNTGQKCHSNSDLPKNAEIAWQKYYTARLMLAVYAPLSVSGETGIGTAHYVEASIFLSTGTFSVKNCLTHFPFFPCRPRYSAQQGWPAPSAFLAHTSADLSTAATSSPGAASFLPQLRSVKSSVLSSRTFPVERSGPRKRPMKNCKVYGAELGSPGRMSDFFRWLFTLRAIGCCSPAAGAAI